jgi:hypothetical protein
LISPCTVAACTLQTNIIKGRALIFKLLRSLEIDSASLCSGPVRPNGKELLYGRWKVERSCGMEGGRCKEAVIWKVEGGKELWHGRWKGAVVLKVEGGKELRYGRWKVESSCGMDGGRWK